MSFVKDFLPEFDQEMSTTRRVLERVPGTKLDWKPHVKSMSFGQLATHMAEIPGWSSAITARDSFDLAPPGAKAYTPPIHRSKEEILGHFDQSVRAAREAITGVSDTDWMKPWSLLKKGEHIFTMPKKAVLRAMLLNHSIHHRAQLGVYLRLNDVPVPQVYGPTADEGR